MRKTCFFTIVSNNYRHFARTLVASVHAHSPEVDAFAAICDGPLTGKDPRDAYTEISIRDLGLPQFDRFTFQYTILELNTAIKPWVFAALFARGYERVIYFDPDIKLYGSVDPVLARLEHAQIVLTPHLTGPRPPDAALPPRSPRQPPPSRCSDRSTYQAVAEAVGHPQHPTRAMGISARCSGRHDS